MLDRGGTALLAALALPLLAACGGIADEFQPNTDRGQLQVTVERAVNASRDDVAEVKTNERLRFMRPVLARTLPPGVEVRVDAAASDFGVYRFGAGWITRGDLYLGRHAVPTEVVEVISSDVNVLAAELVANPADSRRRLVKLTALKPGGVRLAFKTWRLDEEQRRIGALVEDSMALTVGESRGSAASRVVTKPGE